MKYSTFIAALPLLGLATAQPHRRRHAHEHKLAKKDGDVVVAVVNTIYAEATDSPQVIVYVDQDGKPVSTATEGVAPVQTPAPAAPVAPAPAAIQVAPAVENAPAAAKPAKTTASPASTPTYSTGDDTGFGLVYSPYKASGACKSLSEVQEDFKSISTEYKLIRTYGTDCEQVSNVLTVVKARKIKLFAGIFDINNLASQVDTIVKAANGDWSNFDTISVGNELVNSGAADAPTVVKAIGTVRGLLKAAGYTGHVVAVDTLVASRDNPSICDASDYCAVNCHPYFDGKVAAADSGNFLITQIPTLQEKLANKNQKIVVTETGWPWKGISNGAAVASIPNQAAAISSIKKSFALNPESVIFFTAYNDMWKQNTRLQFEAEQFWGMGGTNAPSG
ncbi:hypothetical protein ONS95_006681 [Cadophora gregata]|uniref:uncharacterized protein n=1 Tax=Cadophora gregata TaxID=51156 RepID=UPI0026DD9CC9|nr:uncharacterized protein ONS95_006681 [Cadophora gregata]KAK0101514.1 hypothetical protein ONS95_006681 [Cadophora gregata]